MKWNWQQPEWPAFKYAPDQYTDYETAFQRQAGITVGALQHLSDADKNNVVIELLSSEAVKTAEIEGEILDRDSVQSSLRRHFGLQTDFGAASPAERGIARMYMDLYREHSAPITQETLFKWHSWLMAGRSDLASIGSYRAHEDPMQVVSGPIHRRKVHFEAPPSSIVPKEMQAFIEWCNADIQITPVLKAGIAHLYFVSIHPFEDGNGRIARAVSEKILAQGAGQPVLTALSLLIQKNRPAYYQELEAANKAMEIDRWLDWFGKMVLEAQQYSLSWIEFTIAKTRLLDRLQGQINERQEKALLRMMREGPEGFTGGMSAQNYMKITGASPATAFRDLQALVDKGALTRTGEKKGARYWLACKQDAPG